MSWNPSWFFDRTKLMWNDKKRAYDALDNYAVIAVSDWLLHEAKQSIMKGAKIMQRIYNSIDMQVFRERPSSIRQRLGLQDKFVVLGVATLIEESKGLPLFIELAKCMPSHWRIVLVGDVQAGVILPDNIIAVGKTENVVELAEYYSMADAFAQMSSEETFGKVTAEALACGTPAVVFNSTANPELVGENCGYVVQTKSVVQVLEALQKVEKNGRSFYSSSCRAFIENNMNKERNLEEFLRVYERLLENKKC